MTLVWNEADGHYELRDHDEFLMAIAKVDVAEIMSLLAETDEGAEVRNDWSDGMYLG